MWADILTLLVAFALGFLSKVLFDKYKRMRDKEDKVKEKTEKFKEEITAKLNEFESIWNIETGGKDKDPNTERLKVESEILRNQILEIASKPPSDILPATLEKLKEIAAELIEMGDFLIQIDGGKSYNAFLEKGNNILDIIKELKKELKWEWR